MTWQRRALWVTLAITMAYFIFYSNSSSFNKGLLLAEIPTTLAAIPEALKHVWLALITTARLDFPFVLIAAILSLLSLKKYRAFWILILLMQFATIMAVATLGVLEGHTGPELLRARRYCAAAFILAMIIGYAWSHGLEDHRALRKFVILFLAAGLIAVTNSSYRFYQNPSQWVSLPFTESNADFHITPQMNEDARRVAAFALNESRPIFFLYGYGNYVENTTDPQAFPERLLLYLGPKRFLQQVVFIRDGGGCRYACVPMTTAERARELIDEYRGRAYFFIPNASLPAASIDYDSGGLLAQLVSLESVPLPGTWLAEDFRQYGATRIDLHLSYFHVYLLGY
jgi:hypothetical protein